MAPGPSRRWALPAGVLWPLLGIGVRLAFPYVLIDLAEPEHVEVIAVFHTSRDPAVWQERVG